MKSFPYQPYLGFGVIQEVRKQLEASPIIKHQRPHFWRKPLIGWATIETREQENMGKWTFLILAWVCVICAIWTSPYFPYQTRKKEAENVIFLSKIKICGKYLVRFGPVRFGKKTSGSVRFGGSVKILVRSYTNFMLTIILMVLR